MKINYFHLLNTSLLVVLLGPNVWAQTGIGTNNPRTTLDVNGAFAVTEATAAVSGNAATIPTGYSLVRLTGTATGAITLTTASSPVVVVGQLLTIYNPTGSSATLNGQVIPAGQALNLIYSNSGWQGTAGGVNIAVTAANGLTWTGNNLVLGGTLSQATNVAQGGNVFSLTGGNVGIGTTTPNAPLQLANTIVNRKLVLYEGTNNDHQFYGLGINSGILRYQVDGVGASHAFFAGISATASQELMRINGNGNVGIGTNAPAQRLDVNGTGLFRNGSNNTDYTGAQLLLGYGGALISNIGWALVTIAMGRRAMRLTSMSGARVRMPWEQLARNRC